MPGRRHVIVDGTVLDRGLDERSRSHRIHQLHTHGFVGQWRPLLGREPALDGRLLVSAAILGTDRPHEERRSDRTLKVLDGSLRESGRARVEPRLFPIGFFPFLI